jgi:soluble lytic murein transglycosylase-like protein
MPGRPFLSLIVCMAGVLGLAVSPAAADRLVLTTGRAMVVASATLDGEAWVVRLKSGGLARIEARLVHSVEHRVEASEASPEITSTPTIVETPVPSPVTPPRPDLSARPFAALIERAATVHGVDPVLVHAVIQTESNYQPRARSPKGAKGLMQLMPETARAYGLRNPYDPASNIDAGVRHLRSLLNRFDLRLAVAAYNAGAGAVERAQGLPPFAETTAYVSRVLTLMGQ